jgi:hypothetical protein
MFPPAQYRDSNFESLYLVSKSIFVGTMLSFDDCHTTAHATGPHLLLSDLPHHMAARSAEANMPPDARVG